MSICSWSRIVLVSMFVKNIHTIFYFQDEPEAVETVVNIQVPVPEKLFPGVEKVAAKAVMNDLENTFNKIYKKSFVDSACKVPGSKLQLKKSQGELKKEKRAIHKEVSIYLSLIHI